MGNLMVKSERKALKDLVKKNTTLNRDMLNEELPDSQTKRSKPARNVGFNEEVQQFEYDHDQANCLVESVTELISEYNQDLISDDEEGVDEEEGLVSIDADSWVMPPEQKWKQSMERQDSIALMKLKKTHAHAHAHAHDDPGHLSPTAGSFSPLPVGNHPQFG